MTLSRAKARLRECSHPELAESKRKFFKNCQDDIFLGVRAAEVHKIAKEEALSLELADVLQLFQSPVHEERSLANSILCQQFGKATEEKKGEIFDLYIENRHHIREWNGVDDSAPYIVGAYLLEKDKKLLYQLALSQNLWDRRISIVATWWFIRHNLLEDTFKISELLLQDKEDLIHKATGWMLREAGKRDITLLRQFLDQHHKIMPRTMLRYSIEKFSSEERKKYLNKN